MDTFNEDDIASVDDSLDVLLLMISPSRIFDVSSMIHYIVKLRKILRFDQLLEIAYIASMQNAPGNFVYVCRVILNHLNGAKTSQKPLGKHPYYWYQEVALKKFRTMQGGPHNRYSPFSANLTEIFGMSETEKAGTVKLEKLMSILVRVSGCGNSITDLSPMLQFSSF